MTERTRLTLDDAFAFACRLRGDPALINDPDWRNQPSDPSWPVKVYAGGQRVALGGAGPWWLVPGPAADAEQRLGRLLFEAAGVARVRWHAGGTVLSSPQNPGWVWATQRLSTRRAVPSGGAMYPTEVYVVALDGLSRQTVYHYDPARHELTDLAHPHVAPALRAALRLPVDAPLSPLVVVLTHRFCKNLHKYGNFAYRLGAMDVGVVLGRLVACGAPAFGTPAVHIDFDDAALGAMCGLDDEEEAAYAVVALGSPRAAPPDYDSAHGPADRPSPPAVLHRGRPARPSATFAGMHAAASAVVAATGSADTPEFVDTRAGILALPLPPVPQGERLERRELLRRTSSGAWFTGAAVSMETLAGVLHSAHTTIETLRAACCDPGPPAIRFYCAISRVERVPAGWYLYEPRQHGLISVGVGRAQTTARELQRALHASNVDLERSAFSVHVAGPLDFRHDVRGARAYRVQQLFAGAAVEILTRRSVELRAGSHALLGFDAARVDQLYGLAGGATGVLAQVSVGVAGSGGALEGSVIA